MSAPDGLQNHTVLASRDGRIGRIQLNRPQALNALDPEMLRAITAALAFWRDDARVHAVVVESASDRAFCAGGDIRALYQSRLAGDNAAVEDFFTEEYALNLLIADYPKPYVALVDAMCMGGGVGIALHGSARVATEHSQWAMPETGIGFFPDVGTSHALPRVPGSLGIWFALTGARLSGSDAVHIGLATHFVPRAGLPALARDIARDGVAALAIHAVPPAPFSLAPHRELIDDSFSAEDVPGIIARLEAHGGAFAKETVATLRARSPSALVWSLRLLRDGAGRTLPEALEAELRAACRITAEAEFIEGVRAMVVDKDRAPNWRPARVVEVDRGAAEAMVS